MKKIGSFVLATMLLMIVTVVSAETTVIIGGKVEDSRLSRTEYYKYLEEEILPGEKKIVIILEEEWWDFSGAVSAACRQIEESVVAEEKINIVGFSLGGLIAWEIAAKYRKKVIAVVALSTPFGGYKWCPRWIFPSGDKGPNMPPLFAIAAYKEGLTGFFLEGKNDGVVSVSSVLNVGGGREATDFAVLAGLRHMDLLSSKAVVDQINRWLAPLQSQVKTERVVSY